MLNQSQKMKINFIKPTKTTMHYLFLMNKTISKKSESRRDIAPVKAKSYQTIVNICRNGYGKVFLW